MLKKGLKPFRGNEGRQIPYDSRVGGLYSLPRKYGTSASSGEAFTHEPFLRLGQRNFSFLPLQHLLQLKVRLSQQAVGRPSFRARGSLNRSVASTKCEGSFIVVDSAVR